jgi:hypothetical protein
VGDKVQEKSEHSRCEIFQREETHRRRLQEIRRWQISITRASSVTRNINCQIFNGGWKIRLSTKKNSEATANFLEIREMERGGIFPP